jgi:Putative DNA-binding domain
MEIRNIEPDEVAIILNSEESHFLDLKDKEIAAAKLSRTVSAFCNTAGGELFIGISEGRAAGDRTRAWEGVNNQEDANGTIQAIEALLPLGTGHNGESPPRRDWLPNLGRTLRFQGGHTLTDINLLRPDPSAHPPKQGCQGARRSSPARPMTLLAPFPSRDDDAL